MPDHRRGYTRRGKGYQRPDPEKAKQYRENATSKPVEFDRDTQRLLIEELLTACRFQKLRCHAGSTEPSHIHGLVSWEGFRPWERVRASLKSSLSRRLSRLNSDFDDLIDSLDLISLSITRLIAATQRVAGLPKKNKVATSSSSRAEAVVSA
jgi:hypothetical protein